MTSWLDLETLISSKPITSFLRLSYMCLGILAKRLDGRSLDTLRVHTCYRLLAITRD